MLAPEVGDLTPDTPLFWSRWPARNVVQRVMPNHGKNISPAVLQAVGLAEAEISRSSRAAGMARTPTSVASPVVARFQARPRGGMFLKRGGGKFLKDSAATGGIIQKNDTVEIPRGFPSRRVY